MKKNEKTLEELEKEFDRIEEMFADIDKQENKKDESFLENTKFELDYWWHNSIMHPIRKFFKGLDNLWKWRKIIWNDRWWDYTYFLELLRFKLHDMEEHWGRDTHYLKDYDDKKRIQDLIEDLEWMLNEENIFEENYEEEYKKRSRRFFGRLDRNHRKFWD
jgi:hypothetical protein